MNEPIYLDNNATTSLAPQIVEVMTPFFLECLNPSSVHACGRMAKKIVEEARAEIASYLKTLPQEILFTSGGTESMNTLIKGLYPGHGKILSTKVEHSCVYQTLKALHKRSGNVHFIEVGRLGAPSIEMIASSITKETTLLVFSAVYSETGACIDLEKLSDLAKKHAIPLVLDGVALLGKESFIIPDGVTAMGFSSHKLHGPRGVGAFFLRLGTPFTPLLYGGHQENGKRAGTEAVEAIVGFGKAVSLLSSIIYEASSRMRHLRDMFEDLLKKELSITINGGERRVSNTSHITFDNIDGETLLLALERRGIYASMGSACSSGALEPSRVLLNMGFSRKEAKSSLRFSFSRMTTEEEIKKAAHEIIQIVKKLL